MHSPILRAELHYQRTGGRRARRWLVVLTRVFVIGGLLSGLALFALELWSAVIVSDLTLLIGDTLQLLVLNLLPLILLLPLTLVAHFTLLLRTLMLSSNTIRREQRQRTWQLLLLTDARTAQIVIAKWGATILRLTPAYLLLALLRVGVTVFVGLELLRFDNFYYDRNSVQFFFEIKRLPLFVHPLLLVLGAGLITLFTFGNLLLTAALGVLVSVLRRGGHGGDQVALGLILRTVLLGLPALLIFANLPGRPFNEMVFGNALGLTLLDNGSLVSAALLTAPRYRLNFVVGSSATQFYPPEVIPYVLGVYALITLGALVLAIGLARRE